MEEKFCGECGTKLVDNKCPRCNAVKKEISSSFGWGILGFFFPIVGLILFLVWKKDKKSASRAAGIGALVGFLLSLLLSVLSVVFFIMPFGGTDYDDNPDPKIVNPPVVDPTPKTDDKDFVTINLSQIDTSKNLSLYDFTSDSLQVIEEGKEYDASNQGFKLLLKNGTISLIDDLTGDVYDTVNNVNKAYYHMVDCSGWDSIVVYSGSDIYYANPRNFSYLNYKFKKLSGKYNSIYIIKNIVWTCGNSSLTVGTTESAKGDIVLYDLNTETIFSKETYNYYESENRFIRTSRSFQFDSISGSAKLVIKSSVSDEILGVINYTDDAYDVTETSSYGKLGKVNKITIKDDVTTLYLENGLTKKYEFSKVEY